MPEDSGAALRRTPAAMALVCLSAAVFAHPTPAFATLSAATTLDGPSADVVGVDGVAMSEDGTGGLVYRKRVDGRVHVFAAQFVGGAWRAPQRVDAGQRFDSSWPAIGAADGGRLVVTWVHENGVESDRLFAATIDAGARRFGAPVPVDMNVGEATDTWPDLAMSRGGQAYLTYRVCKDPARNPTLPPGSAECELRLARSTGQLWSPFGYPLNRNSASPVTRPDADNRPKVAVDPAGNAVVAWQEPDDEFVDRIWARRVFGATVGVAVLVSPQKIAGQPLRAPADQLDLDVAGFGQATIAFRQRGTRSGPQKQTRVWAATMAESFVADAAKFAAPRVADGLGPADPPAAPGPVSVAGAPGGTFVTAFGLGVESLLATGDDKQVAKPERLDDGGSSDAGDPQVDLAASGALASAYRVKVGGRSQIGLLERRADGVPDRRTVASAQGGTISAFSFAGSGLGDALVAWRQGADNAAQVVAATIDAPPSEFAVQTPADFVADKGRYTLRWDPAANAVTGVKYSVLIDDEEIADGLTTTRSELNLGKIADGAHAVSVVARDGAGQETTSAAASLKLDRRAPRVTVERRRGRKVRVVVRDGQKGEVSGADHAATEVRWGDGRSATGREGAFAITHTFKRPGRHRVTVSVKDQAGNAARIQRTVTVR